MNLNRNHQSIAGYRSPRLPTLSVLTDLPRLDGQNVLAVLDDDNLLISAREHGRELLYGLFLARLQQRASAVTPVAVFTINSGDNRRTNALDARGWDCVVIERQLAVTTKGVEWKANADADIAFEVGARYAAGNHDVLLIGSGDGDLVLAIARGARRLRPDNPIYVLSVPGATSSRIPAAVGTLLDGSVLLGQDMVLPVPAPRRNLGDPKPTGIEIEQVDQRRLSADQQRHGTARSAFTTRPETRDRGTRPSRSYPRPLSRPQPQPRLVPRPLALRKEGE